MAISISRVYHLSTIPLAYTKVFACMPPSDSSASRARTSHLRLGRESDVSGDLRKHAVSERLPSSTALQDLDEGSPKK